MTLLDRILSKKALWAFGILYLLLSIAVISSNYLSKDTLYYWDWSRHLAASYYDGPPLIAYLLFLHTKIFGSNSVSINLFSVLTNLVIALFIYLLGDKLFGRRVAKLAVLIWLNIQFVFICYVQGVTYDTALAIFWIATVYYFYRASISNRPLDFYLTGLCAGLALLGKYNAVLLWAALFLLMLISKHYRHMLKNKHTYFSVLLGIAVFSPVIIWNIQHHFISFSYQLKHGLHHQIKWGNLLDYLRTNLREYHIFFLIFMYCSIRHAKSLLTNPRTAVLVYPAWAIFLFFFVCAVRSTACNWNMAYFLTAVILIASYINNSRQWLQYLVIIAMGVGFALIANSVINRVFPKLAVRPGYVDTKIYQSANSVYKKGDIILTHSYQSSAALGFYLAGQPQVYSFPNTACQYRYWSKKIFAKLKSGKIKSILYFTHNSTDAFAKRYFSSCQLVKPLIQEFRGYTGYWRSEYYMYRCSGYRVNA